MRRDLDPDRAHDIVLSRSALRAVALLAAALDAPDDVLAEAEANYHWLTGPHPVVRLTLTVDPPVDKNAGALRFRLPAFLTDWNKHIMQVELPDTQDVTVHVTPTDAAGFAESDTITWTAADSTGAATTAVTLTPSADTLSVLIVSGTPTAGIVVTAADPNGNTAELTVDVIGGPVKALSLTADAPVDKAAATPAPAAPTA